MTTRNIIRLVRRTFLLPTSSSIVTEALQPYGMFNTRITCCPTITTYSNANTRFSNRDLHHWLAIEFPSACPFRFPHKRDPIDTKPKSLRKISRLPRLDPSATTSTNGPSSKTAQSCARSKATASRQAGGLYIHPISGQTDSTLKLIVKERLQIFPKNLLPKFLEEKPLRLSGSACEESLFSIAFASSS